MLHFLHTKNFVLQNADPIIHLLKKTNEKSVSNLLQHMTFQHYKLESKLPSHVDFAFKGGSNRLSIIVQETGRRKQKGGLALVKCHLKHLLFI